MDVTNEVITSRGLYTLKDGDVVDFWQLSSAIIEWHKGFSVQSPDSLLTLHMVSGGVIVHVDVMQRFEVTSRRHEPHDRHPDYLVALHGTVLWRGSWDLNEEDYTFGQVPRRLTNDFEMIIGRYGVSLLEGLALVYSDIIQEKNKMS